MAETDLLDVTGETNDGFVKNNPDVSEQRFTKEKKTANKGVIFVVLVLALLLVIGGAYVYRALVHKSRESGHKEQERRISQISIPVSVTKPIKDNVTQQEIVTQGMKSEEIVNEPLLPISAEIAVCNTYVILENMQVTDEIRPFYERRDYGYESVDYVKVNCSVRYTNHFNTSRLLVNVQTGEYGVTSVYDIHELYVRFDVVQAFTAHDMVMIQLEKQMIDDQPYYFPMCNVVGAAEYLPIDNGRIIISGYDSFTDSVSFSPIDELNAYLDDVTNALVGGKEPTESSKKLPKQKFSDGMTVQEIIDFFEAFNAWSEAFSQEKQAIQSGIS